MTLEEKMEEAVTDAVPVVYDELNYGHPHSNHFHKAASACSTIAREHAIGFAEWLMRNTDERRMHKNGHWDPAELYHLYNPSITKQ